MDKYKELLQKDIIFHLIIAVLLIIMVIAGLLFVIKLFNYLESDKKYIIISCSVSFFFIIGILITTLFNISKPIKDLKNDSYEIYLGKIEFIERKSSRYTYVYKLNDLKDIYLKSDRGFIDPSVKSCEAKVVYAKNSKKILELEVLESAISTIEEE